MPFLTEKQKNEVVQLFKEDKLSFNKIAEKYNVTGSSIGAFYKKIYGHSKFKAIPPQEAEKRREEIIFDLKTGTFTLEEIANKYNISRQRVHEISLKIFRHGYAVRRAYNRELKKIARNSPRFNCPQCGKPVFRGTNRIKYCQDCSKFFKARSEKKIECAVCGKFFHPLRNSNSKFCSRNCFFLYRKRGIKKVTNST